MSSRNRLQHVAVVQDKSAFPSPTAARLYDLVLRLAQDGITPWMTIAKLRSALKKTTTHLTFAVLNARVLQPAVREVSETSNIRLEMAFQKTGRKITHVRFAIAPQPGQLQLPKAA